MAKRKPLTADAEIKQALMAFEKVHPTAKAEMRRYNSASIRVRVIDPRYESMSKVDRDEEFWDYMAILSDDAFTQITMNILVTPDELSSSFANFEFEHPSKSLL